MLNKYYNTELSRLRKHSLEFARANPAIAPMLGATSTDPDIEILLQGVAYLNGLTLQKLDDEFPEINAEKRSSNYGEADENYSMPILHKMNIILYSILFLLTLNLNRSYL